MNLTEPNAGGNRHVEVRELFITLPIWRTMRLSRTTRLAGRKASASFSYAMIPSPLGGDATLGSTLSQYDQIFHTLMMDPTKGLRACLEPGSIRTKCAVSSSATIVLQCPRMTRAYLSRRAAKDPLRAKRCFRTTQKRNANSWKRLRSLNPEV